MVFSFGRAARLMGKWSKYEASTTSDHRSFVHAIKGLATMDLVSPKHRATAEESDIHDLEGVSVVPPSRPAVTELPASEPGLHLGAVASSLCQYDLLLHSSIFPVAACLSISCVRKRRDGELQGLA